MDRDADELREAVAAAWPRAQAHWSKFLLLGAPWTRRRRGASPGSTWAPGKSAST